MHYQLLMSCSSKHITLVFNWKILRSLHTESENSHHIPLTLRQSHLHIASETFVHQKIASIEIILRGYQHSLHLQYHDWGALKQGTEPPTAPRAPQHTCLPTAPGVCSLLCVCVHFGWDKYRALILSIGYHTWPRMSRHFHTHLRGIWCSIVYTFLFRNDIVQ